MRRHDPPVVARVQDGAVVFDPRTLDEGDEAIAARAAALACGASAPDAGEETEASRQEA
jgi:hypothetical protein